MDASGSSRQEDDPADAQRWWDGEKWTAAITGAQALSALADAERALEGQLYPDVAEVRKVEALRERVREFARTDIGYIEERDVRSALAAAESTIARTYYPDIADVQKVEALRRRLRDMEGAIAPPSPFITGAVPTVARGPMQSFARESAARGPGKVSRAIDATARVTSVFARVMVSLFWGFGVWLFFGAGKPLFGFIGIAYLAYLWLGRARWKLLIY